MALVYRRGSVASLIRGANNYSTSASTGAHGLDEKGESGEDYEMRQHVFLQWSVTLWIYAVSVWIVAILQLSSAHRLSLIPTEDRAAGWISARAETNRFL